VIDEWAWGRSIPTYVNFGLRKGLGDLNLMYFGNRIRYFLLRLRHTRVSMYRQTHCAVQIPRISTQQIYKFKTHMSKLLINLYVFSFLLFLYSSFPKIFIALINLKGVGAIWNFIKGTGLL
jgi:hypothetical protein